MCMSGFKIRFSRGMVYEIWIGFLRALTKIFFIIAIVFFESHKSQQFDVDVDPCSDQPWLIRKRVREGSQGAISARFGSADEESDRGVPMLKYPDLIRSRCGRILQYSNQ